MCNFLSTLSGFSNTGWSCSKNVLLHIIPPRPFLIKGFVKRSGDWIVCNFYGALLIFLAPKRWGALPPLRFCLGGGCLRAPPAPPPMRWEGQWKMGTRKRVLKRHACDPTVRYDGRWYDSFQTIANTCNRLSRI